MGERDDHTERSVAQLSSKSLQPTPDESDSAPVDPAADGADAPADGGDDATDGGSGSTSGGGIVFTSSPDDSDTIQTNLDSAIKEVLSTQSGSKKGNARMKTADGHDI